MKNVPICYFFMIFHRLNKSSSIAASMSHIETSYRENNSRHHQNYSRPKRSTTSVHDERSIKSLDFESDRDSCQTVNYDDYASEPVPTPKIRPTPPKKPLRLSLQRASSLQVVSIPESNHHHHSNAPLTDIANSTNGDKKRAIKRFHKHEHQKLSLLSGKLSNHHSRSIDLSPRFIEHNLSSSRQKFV